MTLASEEKSQQQRIRANRAIDVDVRLGKTMTRHRMGYLGKLRFSNPSQWPLVVKAAAGSPFRVPDCGDARGTFTVPAGGSLEVGIHPDFGGNEVVYSAKIGDYEPEDPIIIIDRD